MTPRRSGMSPELVFTMEPRFGAFSERDQVLIGSSVGLWNPTACPSASSTSQ